MAGATMAPKSVQVLSDRLYWRPSASVARPIDAEALFAFANLTDADQIAAFATRYGLLRMCVHGLPASHNPQSEADAGCHPQRDGGWLWESLSAWRDLAAKVKAVQAIADRLARGTPGIFEDWATWGVRTFLSRDTRLVGPANPYGILGPTPTRTFEDGRVIHCVGCDPTDEELRDQVCDERALLAARVTDWLQLGNVRPVVTWSPRGAPMQSWHGVGLFGGLAVRLAANLGGRGMVPCAGTCNNLVAPGPTVQPRATGVPSARREVQTGGPRRSLTGRDEPLASLRIPARGRYAKRTSA